MKNFLAWEQTLFKNREIFEFGYVPEEFSYRETQMKSIGYAVAPGIEGEQPQNMVCIGPPGTGKTTSFKKIIEEAEQASPSSLIFAYVNCRYTQTHYSVLSEIYRKITGIEPPTSGIALKKLYGKIAKALVTKNKCMFVILDDADFLVLRRIFNDVVNNLLRLNEEYPLNIGLGTVHSIQCPSPGSGLTSVFLPALIKFPVYTWDETFDIMDARAKIGLYPNVAGKEIIEKITDCTIQKGDIRFGIDLLKRSVINAEMRASKDVDFTDVSQAGDLYRAFNNRTKKGYTTFYKTLNKLIRARLVDMRIENRGKNGRTRIISVKQPAQCRLTIGNRPSHCCIGHI